MGILTSPYTLPTLRTVQFLSSIIGVLSLGLFFKSINLGYDGTWGAFYLFTAVTTAIFTIGLLIHSTLRRSRQRRGEVAEGLFPVPSQLGIWMTATFDALYFIFWISISGSVAQKAEVCKSEGRYYIVDCRGLNAACVFGFIAALSFLATTIIAITALRAFFRGSYGSAAPAKPSGVQYPPEPYAPAPYPQASYPQQYAQTTA
ncbi:hypothetical protein HDV00_007528 [Rhizophlyctis rosea]|nr:hypothetical protein HDV00_007528 [Rhizophlyctis rosea]